MSERGELCVLAAPRTAHWRPGWCRVPEGLSPFVGRAPVTRARVAAGAADAVAAGLARIREEQDVPGPFPAEVLAEAERAAAAVVDVVAARPDRTAIA